MATGSVSPFQPVSSAVIAASVASAVGNVTPADSVLVYNASASVAFVRIGGVGQATVATTADTAVPPSARQLFYCGPQGGSVAVILAAGAIAANVYLTSGQGTQF